MSPKTSTATTPQASSVLSPPPPTTSKRFSFNPGHSHKKEDVSTILSLSPLWVFTALPSSWRNSKHLQTNMYLSLLAKANHQPHMLTSSQLASLLHTLEWDWAGPGVFGANLLMSVWLSFLTSLSFSLSNAAIKCTNKSTACHASSPVRLYLVRKMLRDKC